MIRRPVPHPLGHDPRQYLVLVVHVQQIADVHADQLAFSITQKAHRGVGKYDHAVLVQLENQVIGGFDNGLVPALSFAKLGQGVLSRFLHPFHKRWQAEKHGQHHDADMHTGIEPMGLAGGSGDKVLQEGQDHILQPKIPRQR